MQNVVIAKFGGTSVSSKETIAIIASYAVKEKPVVIVVSALAGVTNLLLTLASDEKHDATFQSLQDIHMTLAKKVLMEKGVTKFERFLDIAIAQIKELLKKKLSAERTDAVISYGELLASYLITLVLQEKDVHAEQVLATKLIVTDDTFGSAEFLPQETKEKTKRVLLPLFEKGIVPIVTGFIGATKKGKITTLGRGGSDYTAAIIGYALSAQEIQIWTDVNGIYTTDPRMVKSAKQIAKLSYREAAELASFGAKVLHPKTISPAVHAAIPVRIKNTFSPEHDGTVIETTISGKPRVLAIAAKKQVILITMVSQAMLFSKGFLERIFHIFATHNISIDLVSVSEVSVSVTLDTTEGYEKAVGELKEFTTVTVKKDVGVVSLIGNEIVRVEHIMRKIFRVLDKKAIPVQMISLGATDINISLVLPKDTIDKAVMCLHEKIILGKGQKK